MDGVYLQVGLVLVPLAIVVLHVLVLRGAARLLRLPVGRVFLRAGASLPRAILAGLAGPLFHLLLATLLLTGTFAMQGVPGDEGMVVGRIERGKPADGKLEPNDLLLAVDGQPITKDQLVTTLVQRGQGAPVTMHLRRAGASLDESITPELVDGQYRLGVTLLPPMRSISTGRALVLATGRTFAFFGSLGKALSDRIVAKEPSVYSGPVGVVRQLPEAARDLPAMLAVFAILSLYVGLLLLLFDAAWIFVRGGPSHPATRQA